MNVLVNRWWTTTHRTISRISVLRSLLGLLTALTNRYVWMVRARFTFAFRHSMHFKTFFLSSCFMRPAYKFSYQSIYKHAPMIRCWIIIIEFGASHRNRTVNATHRLRNHHAYKIICICSVVLLFRWFSFRWCFTCFMYMLPSGRCILLLLLILLTLALKNADKWKRRMLYHSSPYENSVSLWVIAVFCMLRQSEWYDSFMQRLHYRLRMKAWKKKMISWPFDSLRIYILCNSFPLFHVPFLPSVVHNYYH